MLKFLKSVIVATGVLFATTSHADTKVLLTEQNSVVLRGEVNSESVAEVTQKILLSDAKDMYLYIDSPGGSVLAGLQLISVLKSTDKNVTCVASTAASMAFAILQACGNRLVTDSAVLMQHVPSYGLQGQEPNNFSMAQAIHRLSHAMNADQAKRIGISTKEFYSRVRNDWWVWGHEAVKEGVADGVATVSCSPGLLKGTETKTMQSFIFTIEATFSKCPLISGPIKAASQVKPKNAAEVNILSRAIESLYPRKVLANQKVTLKNK
jgi:ATP-dependent Clp protease protease subunit